MVVHGRCIIIKGRQELYLTCLAILDNHIIINAISYHYYHYHNYRHVHNSPHNRKWHRLDASVKLFQACLQIFLRSHQLLEIMLIEHSTDVCHYLITALVNIKKGLTIVRIRIFGRLSHQSKHLA